MNQMQTKTSSSVTFLGETKKNILKAAVLFIAVMYVYYCAIYSVYWYLIK
ncbi:hypothetical protein [Methanobacterium sp. A39]|nr:hypothetical protein [Methanobacterium sp. A39]